MSNSSLNSLKHGCCAVDANLLPTESPADFQALETTWLTAYNPTAPAERKLVAELVNADFLLQRTTKALLEIETRLYTATPNPLDWTDSQQRTLGRFVRYRTAHTNAVAKCRKAIEDYRKARDKEKSKPEPKPKTFPNISWQEHLENMKQKALSLGFTPPPDPRTR